VDKYYEENKIEKWEFISRGIMDYKWYLKEFDEKSLCLWFREWNEKYSLLLWADPDQYDIEKIDKLLEDNKYLPIVSVFDRKDDIPAGSNVIIAEKGNFHFDDPMDGDFGVTRLAWYAHYKSEEFLFQIVNKIDKFRKDKEVTELLREINEKTKRK
jgi:hypothetical protein